MSKFFSRRDFLKLGAAAAGGFAFNPFPPPQDDYETSTRYVGRIAKDSISVFKEPEVDSETVGYLFMDDLINIYYEISPMTGPSWNPLWYRVWGGYIHSAYVQRVRIDLNRPASSIAKRGYQLCEITVPFSQIYQYSSYEGWQQKRHLYYGTTHWVVGIDEGPDGKAWYRLYDELREDNYHISAPHARLIPDEELAPISPDVPAHQKRIEVVLDKQTLRAFENDTVVFETRVSTGIPDGAIPPEGRQTPQGRFNVTSKMPTKHMGDGLLSAGPEVYTLPGVPWAIFFVYETGVAFHGTYWHDNFGNPMSHGCVNMRTEEAKWLFRWTTPTWPPPEEDARFWTRNGHGTAVDII